jgi:hypothetical protein
MTRQIHDTTFVYHLLKKGISYCAISFTRNNVRKIEKEVQVTYIKPFCTAILLHASEMVIAACKTRFR